MTENQALPAAPAHDVDLTLGDEKQLLDELSGFVYEEDKFIFPIHGGYALTYRAVKLACRKLEEQGEVIEVVGVADVRYDPVDPDYILVQVLARRVKIDKQTGARVVLGSEIGSKRKWVKEKLRSGEVRADPSFFEKAVSQAVRNAKQALLPQDFLLEFIKLIIRKGGAKGSSRPKGAPATGGVMKDAPAPSKQEKPEGPKKPAPETKAPAQDQKGAQDGVVDPAKKRQLTMQQQFWVVFKAAVPQLDTEAKQRNVLRRLTGKDRVRDLTEDLILKLGPQLRLVGSGECALKDVTVDGTKTLTVVHLPTQETRWPVGFKAPAPAPAAKKEVVAEEAAASGGEVEERMF